MASHAAILLHTLLDIAISRVPAKDAPMPPEFDIHKEYSDRSLTGSGSSTSSASGDSGSSSGSSMHTSEAGSDRRSSIGSNSSVLNSPSLGSLMSSFTRTSSGSTKTKCKTVKNLPVIRSMLLHQFSKADYIAGYDLKNEGHTSLLSCHLDAEKVVLKWTNHGFSKTVCGAKIEFRN